MGTHGTAPGTARGQGGWLVSHQVVGLPYLHEVLKPVVNRVFEEKKYVELDPCKMELSRGRRVWGHIPVPVSPCRMGTTPCSGRPGGEPAVSPQEDFLQGVPVGGAGAGEQPGAAAGLPGGHGRCHRGLGGQVSPAHEGGLQAAPQAGGGAVPLGAARGGGHGGARGVGTKCQEVAEPRALSPCPGRRCATSPSAASSSSASSPPPCSPPNSSACGSSTPTRAPAARSCCSPRCGEPGDGDIGEGQGHLGGMGTPRRDRDTQEGWGAQKGQGPRRQRGCH